MEFVQSSPQKIKMPFVKLNQLMLVPGEPIRYEPDFSGPVRNRSCTDILWLIVFILFLGLWGYVGFYSKLILMYTLT